MTVLFTVADDPREEILPKSSQNQRRRWLLQPSKIEQLNLAQTSFAQWRVCRIGVDYHVEVDKHFYSVPSLRPRRGRGPPHQPHRRDITKGARIAVHQRGNDKHTTITDHKTIYPIPASRGNSTAGRNGTNKDFCAPRSRRGAD
jgi:hypothetical protein